MEETISYIRKVKRINSETPQRICPLLTQMSILASVRISTNSPT